MLRKLIKWFVIFGGSLLVQWTGLFEQGTAFLLIDLSTIGILITLEIRFWHKLLKGTSLAKLINFLIYSNYAIDILIVLLIALVVTKLFPVVNFTTAYQIITLGKCLCNNSKTKK